MAELDLAELRRLLAEATPGEWRAVAAESAHMIEPTPFVAYRWELRDADDVACDQKTATEARLIAAMRNNLAALLDRLEAADSEAARWATEVGLMLTALNGGPLPDDAPDSAAAAAAMHARAEAAEAVLHNSGMTHSAQCWRWHLGCAVRRVEELSVALSDAEAVLTAIEMQVTPLHDMDRDVTVDEAWFSEHAKPTLNAARTALEGGRNGD